MPYFLFENNYYYFKNPERPTCINLILTNYLRSFKVTCPPETGLEDFNKFVDSVLKLHFLKLQDYTSFQNHLFKSEFNNALSK